MSDGLGNHKVTWEENIAIDCNTLHIGAQMGNINQQGKCLYYYTHISFQEK